MEQTSKQGFLCTEIAIRVHRLAWLAPNDTTERVSARRAVRSATTSSRRAVRSAIKIHAVPAGTARREERELNGTQSIPKSMPDPVGPANQLVGVRSFSSLSFRRWRIDSPPTFLTLTTIRRPQGGVRQPLSCPNSKKCANRSQGGPGLYFPSWPDPSDSWRVAARRPMPQRTT